MFNRCGQSAGKTFDEKVISQEIGSYLSGFTDGEGSFNISIINREKENILTKKYLFLIKRILRDYTRRLLKKQYDIVRSLWRHRG